MLNIREHALYLGKLFANLQGLEFVLRGFLFNAEGVSAELFPQLKNLYDINTRDTVHLNAFTNYDTLRELITKYNNHPKISTAGLTIDKSLVVLRNALAHGRAFAEVIGLTSQPPFRLLKFGDSKKRNDNQVEVSFSALMTEEWFKEQISRAGNATKTVHDANQRLLNGSL